MESVLVLGAGVFGVSVPLHLRRRAFDVLLVDRRQPSECASFGNDGLIQHEAMARLCCISRQAAMTRPF